MQKPDPASDEARPRGMAMALGLGSQLLAGIVIFTWLGWWLDQKRGGGSAYTLGGVFLGLGYGAYEVWKVVRVLNQEAAKPGKTEPPT